MRRVLAAIALTLLPAAPAAAATSTGGVAPTPPAPANAPAPRTWHLGDRALRRGAEGHDVRVLQNYLGRAGFPVDVDGEFGSATTVAVKGFQAAATLRPTGVVGRVTVRALRTAVQSATPVPAARAKAAPVAPAGLLTLNPDGTATAPPDAPPAIQGLVAAANRIAKLPYRYGGGHGDWEDTAYDCSGSVSYALHGGDLLDETLDSTGLSTYGDPGPGTWITIYANKTHVYMYVGGLRFDTSGQRQTGSRWQAATRSNDGFVVRHPDGF